MSLNRIPKVALCRTDQDVVYRNVNQLDKVSNETHDEETNGNCSTVGEVFFLVRFCTSFEEHCPFLDELLRKFCKLVDSFRHRLLVGIVGLAF